MTVVQAPVAPVSSDGEPVRRSSSTGLDGVSVLTVVLVLAFLIPSRLKVASLGGVGSPAALVSLAALFWWMVHHLARPDPVNRRRQPVRIMLAVFVSSVLVSFVFAMVRYALPEEVNTGSLALIAVAAWSGLLLVAHDGIPDLERLRVLARRLVLGAAFVATVGLAQRITGQLLIDRISIPGLSVVQSLGDLGSRSGFTRPMGTTLHPIEFGALLAMALPLALNLALFDTRRGWLVRWYPVVVIAFGISLAIARSALIGAVVGLVVVVLMWPRAVRLGALALIPLFGGVLFVLVPGLLGAISGMFTGIVGDDSAQSRVDSYPVAFSYIDRSPFFGRGLGTFLPSYHILDNQYLLLLIEIGFLGTIALIALFVVAMGCAYAARRALTAPADVQLAQALLAAVAVGAVSNAFYDGFSFPVASSTLFLLVGMCGAMYRLTRPSVSEESDGRSSRAPRVVATAPAALRSPLPTVGVREPARSAR